LKQKKKNRKYPREFKLEAVRMSEEDERPVAEVARQLGISPNNLYKWRELFGEKGEEAFPGKGHSSSSDDEVRRLQRENMRLREEREILKKALVFFSKESK
jgi:transposase